MLRVVVTIPEKSAVTPPLMILLSHALGVTFINESRLQGIVSIISAME